MKNQEPEMDNTFFEEEKKSHVGIVLLLILLILVSIGLVYYFIIDNPKTIFAITASKVLNNTDKLSDLNLDYELDVNGTSKKEDTQKTFDIINKTKLTGTFGSIGDNKVLNGIINYKDNKLLDYNLQINSDDNPTIYFKSDDLYDKVIKYGLETKDTKNVDTNTKDYEQVVSSITDNLTKTLANAKYRKEITTLNGEKVKKVTLIVDEELITNFYNKLLQDDNFMNSYAKLNNITKEEVATKLNKSIAEAKNNDEKISLYVTILKNEFLRFEYSSVGDSLTITKNENRYIFEIINSYTVRYQGYIETKPINDKTDLVLSLSMIKEEVNLDIHAIYKTIKSEDLKLLDMTNVINYKDLTEEETSKIMTKLSENKTFMDLANDLGLFEENVAAA